MLSVSVVVPVRNAARTLPPCLDAIERLDPRPQEIVLVDNGSTDCSLALLRAFQQEHPTHNVQVLEEPQRGAAAARNTGIRAAMGDVVAFTDADCAPEPLWLRDLTEPFVDSSVGAVAGRVVAAPASSILELFSALYTLRMPDRPARYQRWTPGEGGFPTANLAVRRSLLQELNGFDQTVDIYGEDFDLCARLYDQGAAIVYIPEARVAHYHRTTLAGLLRQAFGFGRSHPYLVRRHVRRGMWVELPLGSLWWSGFPLPGWVDLASADKKVLAILMLGAAFAPALALLPLYAAWLAVAAARRAKDIGRPMSPASAAALAALLVLKSGAMTAGRWWGSVKYGAMCF